MLKLLLKIKMLKRADERRLIRAARSIEHYCDGIECEECVFKEKHMPCRFYGNLPTQWKTEEIDI